MNANPDWKGRKVLRTLALVLLPALFAAGCSTGPQPKRLEREGFTLMYLDKSAAGSEVDKMRLNHPVKLSQEEVTNHLLSLRYEELSLLGKKKYVLSHKDVEEISRLLTKAINRLTPRKIVHYEIETPTGVTEGEVFASNHRLHWRFHSIRGMKFHDSSFPTWGGSSWRLVPKKGQAYHLTKKLFGQSTRENWVIADLNLPMHSRKRVQPRSSSESSSTQKIRPSSPSPASGQNKQALEKKLKFLKELKDKDLIDDREYKRKRNELLDTYL